MIIGSTMGSGLIYIDPTGILGLKIFAFCLLYKKQLINTTTTLVKTIIILPGYCNDIITQFKNLMYNLVRYKYDTTELGPLIKGDIYYPYTPPHMPPQIGGYGSAKTVPLP